MNDWEVVSWPPVVLAVSVVAAAVLGEVGLITDVLAGAGLGVLAGNLTILLRARRGIRGREAQIVAAWSAFVATIALLIHLAVEVALVT